MGFGFVLERLVNFFEDGLGFGSRLVEGEERVLGRSLVATGEVGDILSYGGRGKRRVCLADRLLECDGVSVDRN